MADGWWVEGGGTWVVSSMASDSGAFVAVSGSDIAEGWIEDRWNIPGMIVSAWQVGQSFEGKTLNQCALERESPGWNDGRSYCVQSTTGASG